MSARQRQILTAAVENYIATGEPVSSGAIARTLIHHGSAVSSATVRNEMAELADAGLLEQPHTSAGRVPSAQAFRIYVQHLNAGTTAGFGGDRLGLATEMQTAIDSRLAGVNGTQAMLARTSGVLAALSSGVGLAVGALAAGDLLEHVHFTRLAERRVLAVVVGRSGTVRDRVLAVAEDLSIGQLETAANFLNEHFRGWQLERVRAELLRRIEHERTAYQKMMEAAERLWTGAVPTDAAGLGNERSVFVEGVGNLVGVSGGFGGGEDRERLKQLLAALEAKQRVAELLAAYIDSRQESVRVIFELEEQAPELAGLVLIAAPARLAGETLGTVGVLGPKRMDYGATMGVVRYVAGLFDRVLEGGTGS
ncbi:MAG: heat-inducible transcriptional repressor HrcA [Janthinobacterium lividum]